MSDDPRLSFQQLLDTSKAMAESSRLRILLLLRQGEMTVSDLTAVLDQSQPRVSRHLKLLMEVGLIGRYQEGAWAYFHLVADGPARLFCDRLMDRLDLSDEQVGDDLARLAAVREDHMSRAAAYFAANASEWDRIRSLHAPDEAVEEALCAMIGERPVETMLDIGTGTGRMIALFAPLCRRAVGIDPSREMLAIARSRLEEAGVAHTQLRQASVFDLPVEKGSIDLVTIHQVLHYLDQPALAVKRAAAALRPGGRIAIIDFQPHELDFLRTDYAHRRLGFSDAQMTDWLEAEGLKLADRKTIAPANSDEGLTVDIWLACKPTSAA
ncbi:metalloregulator ArsR/SmtB family transcription factor [Notoacmeibacter sp. MSK16QG-6]|uniref:ArsR/SmtB family transcription factor n=1 Tax=Notoacmeibacter sp. MSK16QG-6 TaxID=2957982 RepID=UPI00209E7E8E|nr:metalloregulator ArsR/SmtB family transcription factor [Notoacmeibacter sp. MSK16QG-6]MCP1199727.1 metalloregulator ArsR/SmtB family transcription factor [Notoacmeibacter sp. MSK16QG-6]